MPDTDFLAVSQYAALGAVARKANGMKGKGGPRKISRKALSGLGRAAGCAHYQPDHASEETGCTIPHSQEA